MKTDESIIDFPKEGLCPEVWEKVIGENGQEEWGLTDEAYRKILFVTEYIYECIKDTENYTYGIGAHITGSITSNCYTENSDIDVHFYCPNKDATELDADKLTEAVRAHFEENLKDEDLDSAYIGKHPIEVYFQGNVFQDMMSVGCYDVLTKRWIVGPDFTDQEFNPYSEYYKDIKKTAANLTKQMRNTILEAYEAAIVFKKSMTNDPDNVQQYQELRKDLSDKLKNAVLLYAKARKQRRTLSEPHSKEEALKNRVSRDWHVSDAAFKLFDKFGYLGILKNFASCYELLSQEEAEVDEEIAEDIISAVKNKLGNKETLADADISEDEDLTEAKIDTKKYLFFHGSKNNERILKLNPPSPENIFFVTSDLDYAYQYAHDVEKQTIGNIYVLTMNEDKLNVFDFDRDNARDILCIQNRLWPMCLIEKMISGRGRTADVLNILIDFASSYAVSKKRNHDPMEVYDYMKDWSANAHEDIWEIIQEQCDAYKMLEGRGQKFIDALSLPYEKRRERGMLLRQYLCEDLKSLGYNGYRNEELVSHSSTDKAYGIFSVEAFKDIYPIPLDPHVVDDALNELTKMDPDSELIGFSSDDRNYDASNKVINAFINIYDKKLNESQKLEEELNQGKAKIWVDDIRPAPKGYIHIKSVNEFIDWIDQNGFEDILVIDLDHDAGDYQKAGGDYIRCLDYLEHIGAHGFDVRLHSANPVGIQNMRRIIKKNGWTEAFGIKEKDNEDNTQIDEGAGMISTAMLVGLLAIPNILPAASLQRELKGKPLATMTINSPEMKKVISNATKGKLYNGMNVTNIVNAVARTIYAEAKSEGSKGQHAIASVIWNRAGGKCENLIPVVSKKLQFSCWRKYTGGWKDATYKFSIPKDTFSNEDNKKIWDNCVLLATQLVIEEFTSSIGNRNSYMNKEKADPKNVSSWGDKLDLQIGKHHFGYTKNNDGFRRSAQKVQQKVHIVKSGETLGQIAKQYKTTVDALAKKNNISNPNKISIGQKIVV